MLILFDYDGVLADSEAAHDRFLGFTLTKTRATLEQQASHSLPQDFETAVRACRTRRRTSYFSEFKAAALHFRRKLD